MTSQFTDTKAAVTVEASAFTPNPTTRPKRIDLATIDDVRLHMAAVFRDARSGKIETQDGARLVYMLSQIGKLIEMNELVKRIEILEEKSNA